MYNVMYMEVKAQVSYNAVLEELTDPWHFLCDHYVPHSPILWFQTVVVSWNEDVEIGRCVSKMLQLQCTWAWQVRPDSSTVEPL